jgi:hypothetical protein
MTNVAVESISKKFGIPSEHLTAIDVTERYLQFYGLPLDAELYERPLEAYEPGEPLDLDVYMYVPSTGVVELLNTEELGRHFMAVHEERWMGLSRKHGKSKETECDMEPATNKG